MKKLLFILLFVPLTLFGQNYEALIEELTIKVNLDEGWNMIGYTCIYEINLVEALSEIVSEIVLVKDNNGGIYWPVLEFNSIGNLISGQGYQMKLLTPIDNFSLNDNCISHQDIINLLWQN